MPAVIGAAARDTTELLQLSLEFVPLCVRLAVANVERARELEESSDDWGYVIRKLSSEQLQKVLDEFHKTNVSQLPEAFQKP